jgi:acyl transferase domain-containing protein
MAKSDQLSGLEPIAVIAMNCRFPGARSVDEFWENLRNGVESISVFSPEELAESGIDTTLVNEPSYVNAGGAIDDIELFDAQFFGFSPRDAQLLDPQQRLFLECAWESLELAGYDPAAYDGAVGVYAGQSLSTYALYLYVASHRLGIDDFDILVGNDKDYLATRTSYKLNLHGPSVTLQTACSTSLVAICTATQALRARECDLALAGGVTVGVPQKQGYFYRQGGIGSPDGHCRTFDAAAEGTVGGNGVGIVVLKRLADAITDGDQIRAVIRGAAVNNDGADKVGYTAPSVAGQAQVIAAALAQGNVRPETIGYVEAHGTATPLGDPIEVAALAQIFGPARNGASCWIGSVKTNVGHLDCAAGVAGLIKGVLALEHGEIPPSLHFRSPNPEIDFERTPFSVVTELHPWPPGAEPRRVGVSSFGIGGTNAHVVLEEAPKPDSSESPKAMQVLTLSARTPSALEAASANLARRLQETPDVDLGNVAFTLQLGRRAFPQRRILVCESATDALAALDGANRRVISGRSGTAEQHAVFMFSGQGSQHPGMGRGLYESEGVFRRQIDECAKVLEPELGHDLRESLYPSPGDEEAAAEQLRQTALTQPALFVVEYALAALWDKWGVRPHALIGHSIGEYVAACLAGVFSLEDALRVVAARGRLMQQMPAGAMLAVQLPERDVGAFLDGKLSLSAVNAPALCVVSGAFDAVDELASILEQDGVSCTRLRTSHAFHSPTMEPAAKALADLLGSVTLQPPSLPVISNVTGTWLTAEQATDPAYWETHARQTVRFGDGVRLLLSDPDAVLLEVGPGRMLVSLARQAQAGSGSRQILSSLPHPGDPQPDLPHALETLGRLWIAGVPVAWRSLHAGEKRRRVLLPTYPFERERYWIDAQEQAQEATAWEPQSGRVPDLSQWFYVPSWARTAPPSRPRPGTQAGHPQRWLIFADELGLGDSLGLRLREQGHAVTLVRTGTFERRSRDAYELDPGAREDYGALLGELSAAEQYPERIVHCWNVTPGGDGSPSIERFECLQEPGFYSPLFLAQALAAERVAEPVEVAVVSNRLHSILGDEDVMPEKITTLAACKGVPQEYPNLRYRSIDLDLRDGPASAELTDQLLAELAQESAAAVVAYRGTQRWEEMYVPLRLPPVEAAEANLRQGGVYLITGGLGQIGGVIAEYLAGQYGARLVLVGRTALPPDGERDEWLAEHNAGDPTSIRIQTIRALEETGGEVLALNADVGDRDAMRSVLDTTLDRFGDLHGVIHGAGFVSEDGFRMLDGLDRDVCRQHFRPKAEGALILDELLRDRELDFRVLFSSLSSVLVGLGFIPYAAANAFLDAFAEGRGWSSIAWDGWDFRPQSQLDGSALDPQELVLLPQEGVEALVRMLARDSLPRVIVSTGDLYVRQSQWTSGVAPESTPPGPGLFDRPDLGTPYVAPTDEVEAAIAAIWQPLLGVAEIGVDDNFFDLGGHSLLAIQLVSRMRQTFQVDVSVQTLFEQPTVGELASVVREWDAQPAAEPDTVIRALEHVERLSEEEMQALLNSQRDTGEHDRSGSSGR